MRYDPSLGDREKVTSEFLKDKSKLTPALIKEMRDFIRSWKSGKGKDAIFEPKFKIKSKNNMMMFVAEIRKKNPSLHIVCYVQPTDPNKTQQKLPGNLFIWDRIFANYDEYSRYLTSLR